MLSWLLKGSGLIGLYALAKTRPDLVIKFSHEATLIVGPILILLYVAGLRDGMRYAKVLFVLNIIVVAILS